MTPGIAVAIATLVAVDATAASAAYTAWPFFARPVAEPMLRAAAEQAGLRVDDVIVP